MEGSTERLEVQSRTHIHGVSLDTTASGLADSTISYGESLQLSEFPHPPFSIPTTPILADFRGSPSYSETTVSSFLKPLVPLRKGTTQPLLNPTPKLQITARPLTKNPGRNSSIPLAIQRHLSPHDWHEGASSIDVDAAEDRLLSTSFITSLLQETEDHRRAQRPSVGSDALSGMSGISDLTFSPHPAALDSETIFSKQLVPSRPHGALTLPRPIPSIPGSPNFIFGDSESYQSSGECQVSIIRTASTSRNPNVPGTGLAPAILKSVPQNSQPLDDYITSGRETSSDFTGFGANEPYEILHPSLCYSPAVPSTAGIQADFTRHSTMPTRTAGVQNSNSSISTLAPSFRSKISTISSQHLFGRRRVKPLPPVPIISNMPIMVEQEHRKQDDQMPLNDLVTRASTLHGLLEKGYHPHHSMNSHLSYMKGRMLPLGSDDYDISAKSSTATGRQNILDSSQPNQFGWMRNTIKNRRIMISIFFLLVMAIVVGTVVGVKASHHNNAFQSQKTCPNNFAGDACNLDATCVCTSSMPGQCNGVAQSVVSVINTLNNVFKDNMNTSSIYNNIWLAQGSVDNNCTSQALLLDVGLNLRPDVFPNRTLWAQAALLWNLVQSQDLQAARVLKQFVVTAPWHLIQQVDGPVADSANAFSVFSDGFLYNFATQTVSQPSASFVADGNPTSDQVSRLGLVGIRALDRMYGISQASSTQHGKALQMYWTSSLQQQLGDLTTFRAAFNDAPILLPFDALSPMLQSLYPTASSTSFPPPISCYPNLTATQLARLNLVENGIFNLSSATITAQFATSCFIDRPVYGVLDILRLRLPFNQPAPGAPTQAIVLTKDVSPRAVFYSGDNSTDFTTLIPSQLDPYQYGTFTYSDHVMLQLLSSISDINVAKALVAFVINAANGSSVPPSSTSIIFQSLSSIPTLEVAVFGAIKPSDINSSVSSFTTPSGALFFGSTPGGLFRNWSLAEGKNIAWAENALAPLIVRDSNSNQNFTGAWKAVSTALEDNIQGVGLSNITQSLQLTGQFVTR